ncbi:MAG: hypothetical protein ACI353_02985 [Alloprevotella sp.]
MNEIITITAEFTQTDIAAALLCLGEELTPEMWEQIKVVSSKINFYKIEDKAERMQVKLGLIFLLFGNIAD